MDLLQVSLVFALCLLYVWFLFGPYRVYQRFFNDSPHRLFALAPHHPIFLLYVWFISSPGSGPIPASHPQTKIFND